MLGVAVGVAPEIADSAVDEVSGVRPFRDGAPQTRFGISGSVSGRQHVADAQRRRRWSYAKMASASGGCHADYEDHTGPSAFHDASDTMTDNDKAELPFRPKANTPICPGCFQQGRSRPAADPRFTRQFRCVCCGRTWQHVGEVRPEC